MDRIGRKLGFKEMRDWYRLSKEELQRNGGGRLLSKHGSPLALLRSVYPNHSWRSWRFRGSRVELDEKERAQFVRELGEELSIRGLDDWYRVSQRQLEEKVSLSVFKRHPLEQLLMQAFPDHNWDVGRLQSRQSGGNRASQRHLVRTLEDMFPGTRESVVGLTRFRGVGELLARRTEEGGVGAQDGVGCVHSIAQAGVRVSRRAPLSRHLRVGKHLVSEGEG